MSKAKKKKYPISKDLKFDVIFCFPKDTSVFKALEEKLKNKNIGKKA